MHELLALLMAFENDIPPRNYRLPRRNVIFQTPRIVGHDKVTLKTPFSFFTISLCRSPFMATRNTNNIWRY